jgi:hypothetical protein
MPRPRFQTVIKRSRFKAGSYTPEVMQGIGGGTLADIMTRISEASDVYDQAAKPLAEGYARRKQRWGNNPIRDWRYTGRLMRSLKVLEVAHGRAVLGPVDAYAASRIHYNNRRVLQWGISPRNRAKLLGLVRNVKAVRVEQSVA